MSAPIQPTPFVINYPPGQTFDRYTEAEKKLMQESGGAVFKLSSLFSVKEIIKWKETTRQAIFTDYDTMRNLERVNFVTLVEMLERTSVTWEQMKPIKDLASIIQKPGPDAALGLLYEGISWEKLIALPITEREELLSHYRMFPLVKKLGISNESFLQLASDKRAWLLATVYTVTEWTNQKVAIQEILTTPTDILYELSKKPYRTITLLEMTTWNTLVAFNQEQRSKVLLNSTNLYQHMDGKNITLEQAIKELNI